MALPTLDTSSPAWQRAEAEQSFWAEQYADLAARYLDQFVSVFHDQVVANSPDLHRLVMMVREYGIEPKDAWIRFMATSPRTMLQ